MLEVQNSLLVVGPICPDLVPSRAEGRSDDACRPAKNEALLDEAGYLGPKEGQRFAQPSHFGPATKGTADYVKQTLPAVSVELTLHVQDFPTYAKGIRTDRLVVAVAIELDPISRKALWAQVQRQFIADLPYLNLLSRNNFSILNTRVQDTVVDAKGINGGLQDAWIKKRVNQ